jgi:WD40 repeat protein
MSRNAGPTPRSVAFLGVLALGACTGLERNPLSAAPGDAAGPGGATRGPAPSTGPVPISGGLCGVIGAGTVRAVTALRDGSSFAVGYSTGKVAFYSIGRSSGLPRALAAHIAGITRLQVSPDGSLLVSAASDGEIKLWSIADGELRRVVSGPGDPTAIFAFSPDGATLAVFRYPEIELQRVLDGATLWRASEKGDSGVMFFSPDGATLVSGGNTLAFRRTSDGAILRTMQLRPFYPRAVSPDRTTLLSFESRTATVAAVRVSDGQQLWAASMGAAQDLTAAAFSPGGASVAFVTKGSGAVVLDAAGGQVTTTFSLEDGSGSAIEYSGDGQLLAVGLAQGALRVWHLTTGDPRLKEAIVPGHTAPISRTAFSPDGRLIGSISQVLGGDRTLKVWRASDGALLHTQARDTNQAARKGFAFSPDSSLLALSGGTAGNDRRVYLLAPADGTLLRTIEDADAGDLAFSPDGSLLLGIPNFLLADHPAAVRAWRVSDGAEVAGFGDWHGHGGGGLVFSPDGRLLAAASDGSFLPPRTAVAVWRVADHALLWSVQGTVARIGVGDASSAAFSSDGTRLALGVSDATPVRIYGADDGKLVTELPAGGVLAIAFSPSGTLLAAAGDSGLRLWRQSDWTLFGEAPGQFTAVAFSPDGRTVLAAGRDGVLRLFCSIARPLP